MWPINKQVYSWEKHSYYPTYDGYINDLKNFVSIHIPYLQQEFSRRLTTGIQHLDGLDDASCRQDGRAPGMYDLNGRRVTAPTRKRIYVKNLSPARAQVYLDESMPLEQRINDALTRMTLDEKIAVIHAQSKFSSPGVKRLGFPDLWTDDGPHGVRPDVLWDEWEQAGQTNDSCVAFPALTCLAATWNPDLSRLYGESLGEEALYRNKNVMLGPGVNIFRTPLNGRNFEYMGEDPYLASRMVVPYVQGLQSKGVAACVKHYALNNDEEYRHQVNVKVSDRALHEIYLPAFRAAVQEGGAWAIMGAYNLYQNQHNCHNNIMLNQILGWLPRYR